MCLGIHEVEEMTGNNNNSTKGKHGTHTQRTIITNRIAEIGSTSRDTIFKDGAFV